VQDSTEIGLEYAEQDSQVTYRVTVAAGL